MSLRYSVLLGNLPGVHLDALPIQMTLQSKHTPYDNSTTFLARPRKPAEKCPKDHEKELKASAFKFSKSHCDQASVRSARTRPIQWRLHPSPTHGTLSIPNQWPAASHHMTPTEVLCPGLESEPSSIHDVASMVCSSVWRSVACQVASQCVPSEHCIITRWSVA